MTGDDTLIARFLARRDERAFLAVYHRHTPVIYRVARRMTGDTIGSEDIVQETWIRAIEGIAGFRGNSSLRTWLVAISCNIVRERRRASYPVDRDIPLPADGIAMRPEDPARRLDLERALEALPVGYRDVIVLHDIEGFTHAECAALLGIEESTSRSQLHHARRTMRAIIRASGVSS